MRYGWIIGLLLIVLIGCSPENQSPDAKELFSAMRDHFYQQNSYAFDGVTKRATDSYHSLNEGTFTGRVMDRHDIYLQVEGANKTRNLADEYSMLSIDGKVYEKKPGRDRWIELSTKDQGNTMIKTQKWNPIYYFQMMENWQTSLLKLNQEPPVSFPARGKDNDYLEAFRVVLDSDQIKPWLAARMKGEGQKIEVKDLRDVNAYYNVYVNTKTNLPTSFDFHINADYSANGQQVHERRILTMYFRDYGKLFDLPDTVHQKNR